MGYSVYLTRYPRWESRILLALYSLAIRESNKRGAGAEGGGILRWVWK